MKLHWRIYQMIDLSLLQYHTSVSGQQRTNTSASSQEVSGSPNSWRTSSSEESPGWGWSVTERLTNHWIKRSGSLVQHPPAIDWVKFTPIYHLHRDVEREIRKITEQMMSLNNILRQPGQTFSHWRWPLHLFEMFFIQNNQLIFS